jgi:hypothetical protein
MSTNPVQPTNLAAITCDPRPQLPDGFRRNSTRIGAAHSRTLAQASGYLADSLGPAGMGASAGRHSVSGCGGGSPRSPLSLDS